MKTYFYPILTSKPNSDVVMAKGIYAASFLISSVTLEPLVHHNIVNWWYSQFHSSYPISNAQVHWRTVGNYKKKVCSSPSSYKCTVCFIKKITSALIFIQPCLNQKVITFKAYHKGGRQNNLWEGGGWLKIVILPTKCKNAQHVLKNLFFRPNFSCCQPCLRVQVLKKY